MRGSSAAGSGARQLEIEILRRVGKRLLDQEIAVFVGCLR